MEQSQVTGSPPEEMKISPEAMCRSYEGRIRLSRVSKTYEGGICICRGPLVPSEVMARTLLSEQEQHYFDGLTLERRRQSYLVGRFAAKTAVSLLTNEKPREINIGYGVFNNPIISGAVGEERLETSITHCSGMGAALAFPFTHPMGIDIEKIDSDKVSVIERILTITEIEMFKKLTSSYTYALMLTIAWTIKESLSKVFKTGLMTPFSVYEISKVEMKGMMYVSYFNNFGQYKALSFVLDNYVCSIAFPKNTECELYLPLELKLFP